MALPSWLRVSLTIADFLFQRVDKVGPVQLEHSSDQPPEQAQKVMDAPDVQTDASQPAADVDSPSSPAGTMGFRAGGNEDPSSGNGGGGGGSGGGGEDTIGFQPARAGGQTDPTEDECEGEPPEECDDDEQQLAPEDGSGNEVQCSFRAMRPSDQPTRYDVEEGRDQQGGEGPA